MVLIVFFLFHEGLPIFEHVSFKKFFFGKYWYPTSDPPDFGIFPLFIGSVYVTLLSSIIAVPIGVMTAIYLAEMASPFVRKIVKPLIELLAAILPW